MNKPVGRVKGVFALLLLLMVCAIPAPAQSVRGTLTITAQIVASTTLIIGEDGRTRIVEANGPNGLTITLLDATTTPGVMADGPSTTPTPPAAIEVSGKTSK